MKKEERRLLVRGAVFVAILYGLIPFIASKLAGKSPLQVTASFFSLPSLVLILLVLFYLKNKQKFLHLSLTQPKVITALLVALTITVFTLYFSLKHTYVSQGLILLTLVGQVVLYVLGAFLLASALFGIELWKKTWRSSVIMVTLLGLFYVVSFFLNEFWAALSRTVAKLVYSLLHLFTDKVHLTVPKVDPILSLQGFTVTIGNACSGVNSLSMFFVLFLLLVTYEGEKLNAKRAAVVFAIGVVGTLLMNVIRVTLIMLIGTRYPEFALGLFHAQAGWILFSLFIVGLLYVSYKWMRKKE